METRAEEGVFWLEGTAGSQAVPFGGYWRRYVLAVYMFVTCAYNRTRYHRMSGHPMVRQTRCAGRPVRPNLRGAVRQSFSRGKTPSYLRKYKCLFAQITSRFDGVIKNLYYEPDDMAKVGKVCYDRLKPRSHALTSLSCRQ